PARGQSGPPTGPIEERRVERRPIAVVLVIDRSQSMNAEARPGITQMDIARRSAQLTARGLDADAGDTVGILTFGDPDRGAEVVLPLTPVAERERIEKALAGLQARREATYLADGLERARLMLDASEAAIKHAVVLSDGEIFDASSPGDLAMLKAARFRQSGITLTVIQVRPADGHAAADAGTQIQNLVNV